MKKLAVFLITCSLMAVAAAAVPSGGEPEMKPTTMITRLKVGQSLRVVAGGTAGAGGINIELPTERSIRNLERQNAVRKTVTSKITEIGSDFIVVTSSNGTEKTIAIHAIDMITKLPEVKAEADEPPSK